MKKIVFFIAAPILLGLSGTANALDDNPVYTFLKAADMSDSEAMASAMSKKSKPSVSKFMQKLDGCYLRRVYSSPSGILATWMCVEGEDKSRVLIANVSAAKDGAVLTIVREMTNNIPAPERTGPALAEDEA